MKCIPTGKEVHQSEGKAKAHLRHLQKNGEYQKGRVYPCLFCGGWHVGREKENAHKNKYYDKKESVN